MNGQAGQWTRTPSTTPLQPKKWNASFLDYAQLLMIGWAEWWTQTPSTIPLQPKKMKCSFLDYIQLLMIGRAGQWTQTPSTTRLQPKKEILVFVLRWTSDDQPGWLMDSNPICRPSPANKKKCLFLDYVQLLMISQAGQWTQTPSATPLQQKKWNAHILIMFNFWWSAGLLYGLKPIFHLSPAKKWNGYFWITFNF